MTSSIPSGFSSDELKELLANAPSEPSFESPKPTGEHVDTDSDNYQERISDAATRAVTDALDDINDPMVHKAMVVIICNNFIDFHNSVGEDLIERGETERAAAWFRDGGKFQAMVNILSSVCCGNNDFLCDDPDM